MNRKKDTAYGIKRIKSKTVRAAIIQKIAADFNLMPIMAEAYYKQISSDFAEHADVKLTSGQICYEAVAAEEPAGKHIVLARKVSCRLTLNDVETDLEVVVNYGLAGLRHHRILRLTKEAYDQEVLLSYEGLAVLLTSSPSTMKRDIQHLKRDGYFVMTRGAKHDMGPGLSPKTQAYWIIDYRLYDVDRDRKTKLEPLLEMFSNAHFVKRRFSFSDGSRRRLVCFPEGDEGD